MKRTQANTTRLLHGLTGKEVFSLLVKGYVQAARNQLPTFSDMEYDRMMDDLERRPVEMNECRAWRHTFELAQHLLGDARRVAMEATWRISVIFYSLHCHRQRHHLQPVLELEALKTTLKPMIAYTQILLTDYSRLCIFFEAVSDLVGQDITPLLHYEASILERHVALYNDYAEHCGEEAAFEKLRALHKEGKALDESLEDHLEPILPLLTLPPEDLPPDLKATLTQAIQKNHTARTPHKILQAFDPPLNV